MILISMARHDPASQVKTCQCPQFTLFYLVYTLLFMYPWYKSGIDDTQYLCCSRLLFYLLCISYHKIIEEMSLLVEQSWSHPKIWGAYVIPRDVTEIHAKFDRSGSKTVTSIWWHTHTYMNQIILYYIYIFNGNIIIGGWMVHKRKKNISQLKMFSNIWNLKNNL